VIPKSNCGVAETFLTVQYFNELRKIDWKQNGCYSKKVPCHFGPPAAEEVEKVRVDSLQHLGGYKTGCSLRLLLARVVTSAGFWVVMIPAQVAAVDPDETRNQLSLPSKHSSSFYSQLLTTATIRLLVRLLVLTEALAWKGRDRYLS